MGTEREEQARQRGECGELVLEVAGLGAGQRAFAYFAYHVY